MNIKMKSKQELPSWFNGDIYKEGGIVQNRFSEEEYELNNVELSMYDFIIGTQLVLEMGMQNDKLIEDFHKGLDWFRKNNTKAYMVLLD